MSESINGSPSSRRNRSMFIVDGHLDLAWNALELGRDLVLPPAEVRAGEAARGVNTRVGTCTVTLPALRAGGVDLVFATLFVEPARESSPGLSATVYHTAEEAHRFAAAQLEFYQRLVRTVPNTMLIRTRADLATLRAPAPGDEAPLGLVLLMEGADPIREPAEVGWWVEQGVRLIGPAWSGTRYAGGTYKEGPLTPLGAELLRAMEPYRVVLDTSHLAERAFWDALDVYASPVIASHSNPRAFVPGVRQLSDEQIRAIVVRDGIVGTVFYNAFLDPTWKEHREKHRVTLADAARAVDHVCQLAGDARHAAIGSDLDGGLGREACPAEVDSVADIGRLAEPLAALGYRAEEIAAILGGNWLRLLEKTLPP
ncbi:MAG: membrane dipeptidase [Ardenticatenaceae bacterium]|nr:membrane dipeptidase [Ardenticatenaceae bacterium]